MTPTRNQHQRPCASARSHEATVQRADPSRCHARHTSSAITQPWGKLSRLPQRMTGPRPRAGHPTRPQTSAAPQRAGHVWRRAPTPPASLPASHRTAPSWGRGHLDYAHSEGNTRHPSDQAEQAAAQDLGLWIDRLTTGEQLALAVGIQWLLTSWSRHLEQGTRTMAAITFGHQTGHTLPATMDHPSQWQYVATRLMAHMGAYSPGEMNGLHCQWHQRCSPTYPYSHAKAQHLGPP